MELEIIIFSEISQVQKAKYHIFTHMLNHKNNNNYGIEFKRDTVGEAPNYRGR
jgi:hypothetical protein